MEANMLDAASTALVTLLDPWRLFLLSAGVIMGLILGILPGIGGLAGTALLLPFTFNMDPYAAMAVRPMARSASSGRAKRPSTIGTSGGPSHR